MPSTPSGTSITFAQLNELARRYAASLTAQATLTAEPLRALITEDVHWADPLLPQPLVGAQAVLDFTLTNFHTFPDLVCEIPEPPYLSEDGKRAVFYWRLSGTMKGALPNGVPATGKFVSVEGMDRWEFRDGRICRYRAFYDVMDLLKQCGLMPA